MRTRRCRSGRTCSKGGGESKPTLRTRLSLESLDARIVPSGNPTGPPAGEPAQTPIVSEPAAVTEVVVMPVADQNGEFANLFLILEKAGNEYVATYYDPVEYALYTGTDSPDTAVYLPATPDTDALFAAHALPGSLSNVSFPRDDGQPAGNPPRRGGKPTNPLLPPKPINPTWPVGPTNPVPLMPGKAPPQPFGPFAPSYQNPHPGQQQPPVVWRTVPWYIAPSLPAQGPIAPPGIGPNTLPGNNLPSAPAQPGYWTPSFPPGSTPTPPGMTKPQPVRPNPFAPVGPQLPVPGQLPGYPTLPPGSTGR